VCGSAVAENRNQIDADSHLLAAFDTSDEQVLEEAATLIARRLAE
jgi:putative methionine-R-sulfoxide reductase with GAF domain